MTNSTMKISENNMENITENEAAQYDRQIRLWGLDAQKRLRASRVLVSGLCGLGAEVVKNLVLAGIKSMTLLDHQDVTELDTYANFLAPPDSIGKNIAEASLERAQRLNPMVDVKAETDYVEQKDEEYFKNFDVVCLLRCSQEHLIRINNICHQNKIQFYAGDVFGLLGYMFSDLQEHSYMEEVKERIETEVNGVKQMTEETKSVMQKENYVTLSQALEVDWKTPSYGSRLRRLSPLYFVMHILHEFVTLHKRRPDPTRRTEDEVELLTIKNALLEKMGVPQEKLPNEFAGLVFGQVSPVCAILGGVIAQEVIKAVTHKDQPHSNFFFFSSQDEAGVIECIGA